MMQKNYQELARELLKIQFRLARLHTELQNEQHIKGERAVMGYLLEESLAGNQEKTPGDIAEFLDVSTARVATVLRSLENKGHIIRSANTNDKRKTAVKLTPQGRKQVQEGQAKLLKNITNMLQALGAQDAQEHIRILQRIYHIVSQEKEESRG